MAKSNMDQDILKVLYSEEQLKTRVQEMGDELYERLKGKNPLFLGVLKGSFIFMADIVRACQLKSDIEFIAVSSYQNATTSSGVVQITRDLQQDITDRDIVVIEDILDSGNTLYFLKNYFMTKGASSVTVVTLLDKPARRTKPIAADLAGFEVPDEFVVGYGLDYAQKYRNMPYIGVLKPEVYSENWSFWLLKKPRRVSCRARHEINSNLFSAATCAWQKTPCAECCVELFAFSGQPRHKTQRIFLKKRGLASFFESARRNTH